MHVKTLMTLACVSLMTSGCSVSEVYDFHGKDPVPPREVGYVAPPAATDAQASMVSVIGDYPDEVVIDDSHPVDDVVAEPEWRRYERAAEQPIKVERSDLSAPSTDTVEAAEPSRPVAKDPPADLAERRHFKTYSSRPEKAKEKASAERSKSGSRVESAWADKAVRDDNRPDFDKMVIEAAARGKSSFEDEAGRVYLASSNHMEERCYVVEVSVTARGELPIMGRGTAYVCDR